MRYFIFVLILCFVGIAGIIIGSGVNILPDLSAGQENGDLKDGDYTRRMNFLKLVDNVCRPGSSENFEQWYDTMRKLGLYDLYESKWREFNDLAPDKKVIASTFRYTLAQGFDNDTILVLSSNEISLVCLYDTKYNLVDAWAMWGGITTINRRQRGGSADFNIQLETSKSAGTGESWGLIAILAFKDGKFRELFQGRSWEYSGGGSMETQHYSVLLYAGLYEQTENEFKDLGEYLIHNYFKWYRDNREILPKFESCDEKIYKWDEEAYRYIEVK